MNLALDEVCLLLVWIGGGLLGPAVRGGAECEETLSFP